MIMMANKTLVLCQQNVYYNLSHIPAIIGVDFER